MEDQALDFSDPFAGVNDRKRSAPVYTVNDLRTTTVDAMGAAFRDSFAYSPMSAIRRSNEQAEAALDEASPILTPDEANAQGEALGLRFNAPVRRSELDLLIRYKREELERQSIMERAPDNWMSGAAQLFAGMAGSMVDPVNVALSSVPIVGPARFATIAKSSGNRIARAAQGATEGLIGGVAGEAIVVAQASNEQADYTINDAVMNLAAGAVLGSGLRVAGGEVADSMTRRYLRSQGVSKPITEMYVKNNTLRVWLDDLDTELKVDILRDDLMTRHFDSLSPSVRTELLDVAVKQIAINGELPNIQALVDLHEARPGTTRYRNGAVEYAIPADAETFMKELSTSRGIQLAEAVKDVMRVNGELPEDLYEWATQYKNRSKDMDGVTIRKAKAGEISGYNAQRSELVINPGDGPLRVFHAVTKAYSAKSAQSGDNPALAYMREVGRDTAAAKVHRAFARESKAEGLGKKDMRQTPRQVLENLMPSHKNQIGMEPGLLESQLTDMKRLEQEFTGDLRKDLDLLDERLNTQMANLKASNPELYARFYDEELGQIKDPELQEALEEVSMLDETYKALNGFLGCVVRLD